MALEADGYFHPSSMNLGKLLNFGGLVSLENGYNNGALPHEDEINKSVPVAMPRKSKPFINEANIVLVTACGVCYLVSSSLSCFLRTLQPPVCPVYVVMPSKVCDSHKIYGLIAVSSGPSP